MAIPDPNAEIRDPSPPAPKGPTKINKLISKIKKKLAAIKKMNEIYAFLLIYQLN